MQIKEITIESKIQNMSRLFPAFGNQELLPFNPILDGGGGGNGAVKLIKRVKIAHSFLPSVSNQFHVIILSWPT